MAATITKISTIIPGPDGGLLDFDCILAINITDRTCSAVIWNDYNRDWGILVSTSGHIISAVDVTPDGNLIVSVATTEGKEWKVCFVPGPNH